MRLGEMYKILNEMSPFELQEKWDNSGLQVGSLENEVEDIVLSIDIDAELIEKCAPNTLIITHHPLIFSGVKLMDYDTYPSNLLQKMVQKNISNIAMHTSFDKTHLNRYVAQEVLGYEIIKEEDFLITMKVNEPFAEFVQGVKKAFDLQEVRTVQCHEFIETIALCTGSGASLMNNVQADCFVTGDIKYHDAMAAKSKNLSMIDVNHYESERFFAQILYDYLKIKDITAIISQSKNPFTYISA